LAFCKTTKALDKAEGSTEAADTASSSGKAPFREKSTKIFPRLAWVLAEAMLADSRWQLEGFRWVYRGGLGYMGNGGDGILLGRLPKETLNEESLLCFGK
jgi:hypothetical protein